MTNALAREKKADLDWLKAESSQLECPDFLWHYLLQSFATMGGDRGKKGLIDNQDNYRKVTYGALNALSNEERPAVVRQVCQDSKVNYPGNKTRYILRCFEQVREFGGPELAKEKLVSCTGRDAKLKFLESFYGIGPKYARSIMMDVYHEDFRDSIAVDARIKSISDAWGLSFSSFEEHENFYLSVATDAGLNGWELDRLMFNFTKEFLPSRGRRRGPTASGSVGQLAEESSELSPWERVRTSFYRQGLMRLLGAEVVEVGPGLCVIEVPFSEELTQQERYFHGVVTGAIGDNAGGYAALTLAPPDREVLTVEYKINFLAPAWGEKLVARGEVLSAGRRLFVCKAEVEAVTDGEGRTCATLLQTVSLSPVRE